MARVLEKALLSIVKPWLKDLIARFPVQFGNREAQQIIQQFAPVIQRCAPNEAFGQELSDYLVSRLKFFPQDSVTLRDAITEWWRAKHPVTESGFPPEIDAAPLTTSEKHILFGWTAMRDMAASRPRLALRLGVIRLHSEAVYDYVCQTDPIAAGIADERGWLPVASADRMRDYVTADWQSEDAVRRAIRRIEQHLDGEPPPTPYTITNARRQLRLILRAHAPQHLGLLDEAEAMPAPVPYEGEIEALPWR